MPQIESHLQRVKLIHDKDLLEGKGAVYLPNALNRKYPNAAKEWGWQYVFPAAQSCACAIKCFCSGLCTSQAISMLDIN
jgi:hypothetical protein